MFIPPLLWFWIMMLDFFFTSVSADEVEFFLVDRQYPTRFMLMTGASGRCALRREVLWRNAASPQYWLSCLHSARV